MAQQRGYRCVFVCPDKVSEDKRNVLARLRRRGRGLPDRGRARTTRTPTTRSPTGWSARSTGAWKPDQYSNPEGPASHYETTGPEIWRDTDGRVTHFVTGVGTGGTITGTGRYLKEASAERDGGPVQVVGADPEGSVYSGGTGRPYLVEGVGEDFWPSAYDPAVPDEIVAVSRRRLVRR